MCESLVRSRCGRVNCITRWQARLIGFVESPFPSSEASKDEDDDGDSDGDVDEDEASSSFGDDEMTASQWLPFVIGDKNRE